MSEYQYYEFQAIDRPLSEREMEHLRALSSRAEITPTSFTNTYSWGDFKGDPDNLMEKYFDAFVYVANWGSRRLSLRLPRRLVDPDTLAKYCIGENVQMRKSGECVVVDFCRDEIEEDEEMEGEGWMNALIPLRADILAGDLRCLYLGWLLGVEEGEAEDDEDKEDEENTTILPPPPGLSELSGPLKRFIKFFQLDTDLVEAAARKSAPLSLTTVCQKDFADWLLALSAGEKDSILRRIAEGHAPQLRAELLNRFRQAHKIEKGRDGASEIHPPTANELWQESQKIAELQQAKEAERRRIAKEKQEKEAVARRKEYLAALAPREDSVWREVEKCVSSKQPKQYDAAVGFLKDLHDLSLSKNNESAFLVRLQELRERHNKKDTFLRRLSKAGLPSQETLMNLPIEESQEG